MRKMKKYVVMFCALLAMGASVASCSSDEEVVQGALQMRRWCRAQQKAKAW